jgi:hypothetical protein
MKPLRNRSQIRRAVNNAICGSARGVFYDEVWLGKKLVERELNRVCAKHDLIYSVTDSRYEHDENRVPIRKVWFFEVTNGSVTVEGTIVCSGAGSVSEPLERYDVVAYCS